MKQFERTTRMGFVKCFVNAQIQPERHPLNSARDDSFDFVRVIRRVRSLQIRILSVISGFATSVQELIRLSSMKADGC